MFDDEMDTDTTATALLKHVSAANFVARNVTEAQSWKGVRMDAKVNYIFYGVALWGEYWLVRERLRAVQRQVSNN